MRSREKLRPTSTALLLAALSAATILAASGCAPQAAQAPTGPSTTAASSAPAPTLPTNEEALAIVEELVPAAISAEATANNTGDFAGLEALAGSNYVSEARAGAEKLAAESLRVTGESRVDSLAIQTVTRESGFVVITAYGCYDISSTQLLDSDGVNRRSPDVPVRVPVVFRLQTDPSSFKLMETAPWSGSDFC